MSDEKFNKIEKLFIALCLFLVVVSILSTLNNEIGITVDEQYAQVTFYNIEYVFVTIIILVVLVVIITNIIIVNLKTR